MTTHVDLNKLLTVRTATLIHTFPPFEDRVEFFPVFTSLESQCVGQRRWTQSPLQMIHSNSIVLRRHQAIGHHHRYRLPCRSSKHQCSQHRQVGGARETTICRQRVECDVRVLMIKRIQAYAITLCVLCE